jgi:hypothetical protein
MRNRLGNVLDDPDALAIDLKGALVENTTRRVVAQEDESILPWGEASDSELGLFERDEMSVRP